MCRIPLVIVIMSMLRKKDSISYHSEEFYINMEEKKTNHIHIETNTSYAKAMVSSKTKTRR